MDTHTSSSDDHQFNKEELHEEPSNIIRNSLPYQSLLLELHNLNMNHEASFQVGVGSGIQRRFELAPFMLQEILILQQELILQQMIFMLFLNHGVRSETLLEIQTMAETEAEPIRKVAAGLNVNLDYEARNVYFDEWESGLPKFHETIDQKIKPRLKEFFLGIIDRLLEGNSSAREYGIIFVFINVIFIKLKDIQYSKPNLIDPVKKEMQILEEMLNYALIISRKLTNPDENLEKFLEFFEPWVNTAAAVVTIYWVDEKDEEAFSMVSSSLQKFNLSILEYVEAYIIVAKALRPSNVSEILLMRGTVGQFTNMILEKLIDNDDDDDDDDELFDAFREGLTFWIALLVDPPKAVVEHERLICSEINLLLDQAKSLICSLCPEKMDEDSVAKRRNTLANDFLEKINKAKAEVKQLPVHEIPGLSWNSVPMINTKGFFDFLLGNLQKKLEFEEEFFPFEKHIIETVHEDLSTLRPILMDIFELQDKHKVLKDIWVQASSVAYLVDYLTDFCLSSIDVPIWSILMHLCNAMERLQSVETKVSKIRKKIHTYKNRIIHTELNSKLVLPGRQEADVTTKNDIKVGFVKDEQRIFDRLIAGESGRDIVAIVGMPGQGKTHLAQRVYQNTIIKHHFNKLAWCCISQSYDMKNVLRDILEDVGETVSPEQFSSLTQEDLANQLKKCLKGKRYIVVLDDMWDAKAWSELNLSFPDDNNGSRVLITSRNHNVPLKIKANCSMVELHPLSPEDSWNLMRTELFNGDCCPPALSDTGKSIAENCKGLPLAILVVAGLLKNNKNVDSWKQVSESVKSHIANKDCMNILELSYKHLPDYLKPCFVYLGAAFREDQLIDAKQLIQFWIAEGFVQNDGIKTMEVVGKDYLMDLASRSLVIIAHRSSRNGIRKFRVHDLLQQLCLIKAAEERFLLVPHLSDLKDHHHHRISVHEKLGQFLDSEPIVPGLRSLLVSVSRYDHPSSVPFGFLKQFKLIRVLDLSYAIVTQTDFHDITQLIHLRLLAVACRFSIPPSIVNLLRLEVLRFRYAGASVTLPTAVIKMASLRHIFASKCTIEYTEDLDKLVPDLSSSPLTNLETFTSVLFIQKLSFKRVAEKLPYIRKLGITLTFCVPLSNYFEMLESLSLSILGLPREKTELICPDALDFPLTLKKLNLTVNPRPLSVAMISSIGKLRNLEVLKLHANFEDDKWDVEVDEFLQLKYFDFRVSSIQEWNVSDESFPCLEQLLVRKCFKLGELPARFGSVANLTRIVVRDCSETLSDSFQQIVDDQMDAGNEALQYSFSSSASSES